MFKVRTIFALLLVTFSISSSTFASEESFAYRTGQIIGISQREYDPSTYLFELVTGSRFGHVGFVITGADIYRFRDVLLQDDDFVQFSTINKNIKDLIFVAESRPGELYDSGVSLTNIHDFMKSADVYSIIEPKEPLSDDQIVELILFTAKCCAKRIKGTLTYNHRQKMQITYSPTKLNCSEFIHWAFRKINIIIGRPQQMKTLNLDSLGCLFLIGAWIVGMYDKDAYVLSPKSIMQSAVNHAMLNPEPPMAIVHDGAHLAKTYSVAEIRRLWQKPRLNQGLFSKTKDDEPFEEICFKEPEQQAMTASGCFAL